eukprot:234695-Pleurochrysis_carterae.AAC.1
MRSSSQARCVNWEESQDGWSETESLSGAVDRRNLGRVGIGRWYQLKARVLASLARSRAPNEERA